MRYFLVVLSVALLSVVLEAVAERPARAPVEDAATVGTVTPSRHCGCVNWKTCTEPCSACCGPRGYEDCFKNPDPTCCAMRRLVVLLLLLLLGCGPLLYGGGGSGAWSFVVVVHNTTAVPVRVSISTDLDGYAAVNTFQTIPAGGTARFDTGFAATPSYVFLHNPLTWSVPGFFWYDQNYHPPSDYAADARAFELWYP